MRMQIQRSSRQRFGQRDFDLLAAVSGVDLAEMLDPEALDAVLSHPAILQKVLAMRNPLSISADLYFYVLVRHALREAGLDSADLADYVAATLSENASKNPFKTEQGDRLQIEGMPYYVDYLQAMGGASAQDRFFLDVRCGNQFLVMTGLFADCIKHREKRRGAPGVDYYEQVACQSYQSASRHPLADEFDLREIYAQLVGNFQRTRRALNRMSSEYLF